MRRRFSFTIAFAVLVVAQFAILAFWNTRQPPPSKVRDQIDNLVHHLRTWADMLEKAADMLGTAPHDARCAQVMRGRAKFDRRLADRLSTDPTQAVSFVIGLYLSDEGRSQRDLLQECGRAIPPTEP